MHMHTAMRPKGPNLGNSPNKLLPLYEVLIMGHVQGEIRHVEGTGTSGGPLTLLFALSVCNSMLSAVSFARKLHLIGEFRFYSCKK
jgi:hypothetical protein